MNKFLAVLLPLLVSTLLCGTGLWAQVSVVGELSQDREARPGERYEGIITVRNDTDEPQEAKIYQTDYLFYFNGTNNYGDPGTTPRSNAKWISFSPSYVVIPPQGSVTVNYTVIVPPDRQGEALVGTYWSMLMVEGIPKGVGESTLPAARRTQMGIRQTIRYGIQIATHIANTGSRSIKFLDVQLIRKEDGGRFLQVDVENVGEVGFRPDFYVELFDEKGTPRGKLPGVRYRLYPGTSVRQTIDMSKVTPGTYTALIVVDGGGDDIFGAQHILKF